MARIVLVHGAFAGAWCWEPVLPGLRAAGHDVEAIDLPGSGEDTTPVAEVSLDAYATRVCEVLAGGRPAVLVGHSMGGMVDNPGGGALPGARRRARVPGRISARRGPEPDGPGGAARGGG